MRLYHASTIRIEKPDVLHSRDKLDFGRGFYLTRIREQAVRYAERFTRRGLEAFINEYEFDEEAPGFVINLKSATIIQYTIKGRFMSR